MSTLHSYLQKRTLNEWMNYREITYDSYVMRDLWDTRVARGRGVVTKPKKLSSLGIKRLMERAIWAQGLRKKLELGKKRHPYQANHSLRKWFETRCEISGMKPVNVSLDENCKDKDLPARSSYTYYPRILNICLAL
jgi:hypothetical protein